MSDSENAVRPSKPTALPGLCIIALFVVGLTGILRANTAPAGSLSGPAYLLMAVLAYGYLLRLCFDSR
jgi:hypothetical protein